MKGVSFSSPTNVDLTIHPTSRPNVLVGTCSFLQSMWDPPKSTPPFGTSVLAGTPPRVYPLRGTATPPNPPPSGPSILAGTPPCVYPLRGTTSPPNPPPRGQRPCWHTTSCLPLRGTASSMAHCQVSGYNPNCNSPSPPLADIVFFEISLLDFPSRFSNVSARERFSSYKLRNQRRIEEAEEKVHK